MANWPAIGILTAAEVAVFLGATKGCFTAQARIDRERDSDIRAAVAGYEAGEVVPALAALIEQVESLRAPGEALVDTVNRADVDAMLREAVTASIRSRTPRERERALVHRYTALGVSLLVAHLAAPIALYNVLTEGYNLPNTAVLVASTSAVFTLGAAAAAASFVGLGERALTRAIRGGKDAA